jgi:tryptophan 2,3-dioxygenase
MDNEVTTSNESRKNYSGCPFQAVPTANLTYNDYLKIPTLLDLQIPQSSPAHHDELLFIIIHQAYELWFKLILHEMENAILYMNEGKVLRAQHFMNRTVQILKLLVQQIHLLETMSAVEFLQFRDALMPASGFQSSQFREIEFMAGLKDEKYLNHFKNRPEYYARLKLRMDAPDLWGAYCGMLRAQGFAMPSAVHTADSKDSALREESIRGLIPIYQKPDDHLALYLLSESLVEFDEYLALWREHHVRVVERVIGAKHGTGGSDGVGYLRSTTSKKCFPDLWDVRTYLKKI